MPDERTEHRIRRQFPVQPVQDEPPHPIFSHFPPREVTAEPGWQANYLGVRTRVSYFSLFGQLADFSTTRTWIPGPPVPNEDYFEWIALLEAVVEAKDVFTMMELGAGWGRWLVTGAVAARLYSGIGCRLIGVESEPTHFGWLKQHLRENDVPSEQTNLVQAAVAAHDGYVWFQVGAAADWYGQAIVEAEAPAPVRERLRRALTRMSRRHARDPAVTRVRAVSLSTLLRNEHRVDLVDIDIQGAEADVLEPAAESLDRKVRRVHVGTHSLENEERIRTLFSDLGWVNVYDFPGGGENKTPWGVIHFEDGVQTWLNPALA